MIMRERNKLKDLTGKRFGRLVVLGDPIKGKYGQQRWKCKCDCGNVKYISRYSLLNNTTISCGCYRKERLSEAYEDKRKYIEKDGVKRTLSEWSKLLGGDPSLVSQRLKRGWSEEKAISVPVIKKKPKK